jgi:hypothetical protein
MKKVIIAILAASAVAVFAANYTPVTAEGTAATATITTAAIGTANVATSLNLLSAGTVKIDGTNCYSGTIAATSSVVVVDGLITAINP